MCKQCDVAHKYKEISNQHRNQMISIQLKRAKIKEQAAKIRYLFDEWSKARTELDAWLEDWRSIGELIEEKVNEGVRDKVSVYKLGADEARIRLEKYESRIKYEIGSIEL